MIGFCPLASGSKGNCIYIGTRQTKLLIDAGLSARAITERLRAISVDIADIDAILVSHEHSDHIRGLGILSGKMGIPIFSNSEAAKAIAMNQKNSLSFKIFSTGETFEFGDIEIHPFSVQHDTLDPVAFTFKIGTCKIGVCTDLGFVSTLVSTHLEACNYLYIESNHEPSMVYSSSRPQIYKQRVLGRQGHLSNEMCSDLIEKIYHPGLKHIFLAHLSDECNHPEVAIKRAQAALKNKQGNVSLSIAYQSKVSEPIFFEEDIYSLNCTDA
jgi:phosphoribosyl 1,2-cyclic phosphodiesterase